MNDEQLKLISSNYIGYIFRYVLWGWYSLNFENFRGFCLQWVNKNLTESVFCYLGRAAQRSNNHHISDWLEFPEWHNCTPNTLFAPSMFST
jgi:hypothetical protein